MPEPEILTDPHQMLARALAAKDAEIADYQSRLSATADSWTEIARENDELHAEITTLEWKLSEAEKEIERLGRSNGA